MKKMILAATLFLGACSFSFAQTSLAKNSTGQHPAKMTIAKKETTSAVTPAASTGSAAKTSVKPVKTNQPANNSIHKAATPKKENKMIGKKHKANKKMQKANKKASKPLKTGQ